MILCLNQNNQQDKQIELSLPIQMKQLRFARKINNYNYQIIQYLIFLQFIRTIAHILPCCSYLQQFDNSHGKLLKILEISQLPEIITMH